VCDRHGRALGFRLLPGQRSELKAAPSLLSLATAVGLVRRVVCDRTHPAVPYDRTAYRRRRRVEQAWGRLKEWRAVATRYEKTAESYLGALHVAASLDWIKASLT
jgi:transposase